MNFLFLNHYGGSPHHGMVYRTYYLARELKRLGHQVAVVAASFTHLQYVSPLTGGPITRESVEGIDYFWLKTPAYQGNGIGRMINLLVYCARLYHLNLPVGRPDVVILSSPHPLAIWPARHIANCNGAKLFFEVRDLWPLTLQQLYGYSRFHPVSIIMQAAEDYAYRNADRVLSLLPRARSYMIDHGMPSAKYLYLPNGTDCNASLTTCATVPVRQATKLAALKADGKFLIGYAGAHGNANALKTLIRTAQRFKSEDRCHIVLVGQGPEKARLQRLAIEIGVGDRVTFLEAVPKDAVLRLLDSFDVFYTGLRNHPLFIKYGVSPNKMMDYMLAAKPIISAVNSGDDIIAGADFGISVPPEDPDAVASAIRKIKEMPLVERERMGRRGRRYVETHHDYAVLAEKLLAAAVDCCTLSN